MGTDLMNHQLIIEEEKKMQRLKWVVDLTAAILMQSDMTLHESLALMDNTKKAVLSLFPDKEFLYDLIYTPRFRRILDERFTVPDTYSGKN